MNKKDQIQFYRKQLESSKELKALAMQNYNAATRIESEANSALEMLGANSGQGRKAKREIPDDIRLSLLGKLTA